MYIVYITLLYIFYMFLYTDTHTLPLAYFSFVFPFHAKSLCTVQYLQVSAKFFFLVPPNMQIRVANFLYVLQSVFCHENQQGFKYVYVVSLSFSNEQLYYFKSRFEIFPWSYVFLQQMSKLLPEKETGLQTLSCKNQPNKKQQQQKNNPKAINKKNNFSLAVPCQNIAKSSFVLHLL